MKQRNGATTINYINKPLLYLTKTLLLILVSDSVLMCGSMNSVLPPMLFCATENIVIATGKRKVKMIEKMPIGRELS